MLAFILAISLPLYQHCLAEHDDNNGTIEVQTYSPTNNAATADARTIMKMFDDTLLNYNRKFRPGYGGEPVKIHLDMQVLSFSEFDESAMEFGMDFYLAQFWTDERFEVDKVHPNSLITLVGNDVDTLWLPDTVFVNSKSSKFHDVTVNNRNLMVNFNNGNIQYHVRITTKASCRMDLRDYPFDQQTCFLAIESYGHDDRDMRYKWYQGNTSDFTIKVFDKEMSNFDVIETIKSKKKTPFHTENISGVTARFKFQRLTRYFIVQVYLPCILIVMVTWTSFWITPTAVPARCAICVTAILTLITMLGIVNSNMPKVSYIKALDLYVFVSFIFVFLSLLEYILVLNIADQCQKKKGKRNEITKSNKHNKKSTTISKEKLNNGILSIQEPLVSSTCSRRNFCQKRNTSIEDIVNETDEVEDCIYHQSRIESSDGAKDGSKSSTSSMTDMVARFLFPFVYACFNIGYWTFYLTQKKEFQKGN